MFLGFDGKDHELGLYETANGGRRLRFDVKERNDYRTALSADGKFAAIAGDNDFYLMDATTGKLLAKPYGISPESKLGPGRLVRELQSGCG